MTMTLKGASATCDAECVLEEKSTVANDDGCCPKGAKPETDNDCSRNCGNGVLDETETCEPTSRDRPCPSSCDDGDPCTVDVLTGSAAQCSAQCVHTKIVAAKNDDMCCPQGASANTDSDCQPQPKCGNGIVEPGETCDGNCPTACDDSERCTDDALLGHAALCNAKCVSFSSWANPRDEDDTSCSCASDADCYSGDVGYAGHCGQSGRTRATTGIELCAENPGTCGSSRRCDTTWNSCHPIDCTKEVCPSGTRCQIGFEQTVCVPNAAGGGIVRAAVDRGDTTKRTRANPYAVCVYDQDCGGDLKCLRGTCTQRCNSAQPNTCPSPDLPGAQAACDADCLFGSGDPAPCSGVCVVGRIKTKTETPTQPSQCDPDITCPAAQKCSPSRWTTPDGPWLEACLSIKCENDAQCGSTAVCVRGAVASRYCVPKP